MTGSRPVSLSAGDRARVEEIEKLGAAGAVDALIARLVEPSWAVRRAAVGVLAQLGHAAVEPMIASLSHARGSETHIAALVDALSTSTGAPERALEALGGASDPAILCDVAQILGRRRDAGSASTLALWVMHANDNVAVSAMEALGHIGGAAGLEAIIAAASSRRFFRVFPAIDVLARSGDPRAVAPLAALLGDPVCSLEAARALGRTGDLGAATSLASLMLAANEKLVRVAAIALAEIDDYQHERLGASDTVLPAVRALPDPTTAARRIERCFEGAEPSERIALSRVLGWLGAESAAATLVGLLGSEPAIARSAALALRRLGPVGERQILLALRHATSAQRALLLPLVPLGFDATADVASCLEDPDAAVRARACEMLGRIGDVSAVPSLFARLADVDAGVAQSATGAIHGLGSEDTERRALAGTTSDDPRVRRAAVRIIGYFGWPGGLDALVSAVKDSDERVRDSAIQSLAFIDDARALDVLLALGGGDDAHARASAMRAIGRTQTVASAIELLVRGLRDADPWVRYYACQALGRFGGAHAIEAMLPLLDDPAGQVRVAAIEALACVEDVRATQALVAATGAPDPDARRAALLALGMARSTEGLPAILTAASSSDVSTRLVALSALASFETALAEEALARAAYDVDASVRATAFGFLGARAGSAATLRLVGLLDDDSARDGALGALSHHARGRVPAVLGALEDADGARAQLLVASLCRMQRPDARAALGVALVMDRVDARRAAAAALGAMMSDELVPSMERAALGDADAEVRRLASFALSRR